MRIAIGIISMGRAAVLADTLRELRTQTRSADRVLVCSTCPADVAGVEGAELFEAPPSTSGQRNRLLTEAADCDLMVFFDDDFQPEPGYLAETERVFASDQSVVVSTGVVLADGAKGLGFSPDAGRDILDRAAPADPAAPVVPAFNAYGCNMAVRLSVVRDHGVLFDDRLKYYGWYEDIDFSRRAAIFGHLVRVPGARGVHLGVKAGRTSGRRFGYSQVINPIYLWRKGSYPLHHVLYSVGRHILINAVRSVRPEAHVDRRGRLRGNLRAVGDLLRGRVEPERVRDI